MSLEATIVPRIWSLSHRNGTLGDYSPSLIFGSPEGGKGEEALHVAESYSLTSSLSSFKNSVSKYQPYSIAPSASIESPILVDVKEEGRLIGEIQRKKGC